MKLNRLCVFGALVVIGAVLTGCQGEDEPFTGIKLSYTTNRVDAGGSREITPVYYKDGAADSTSDIAVSLSNDNTGGASLDAESVRSGTSVIVTAGSTKGASVVVTFSANGKSSALTLTTRSESISASDSPVGFAASGVDMSKMTNTITVFSRSDLITYAEKGGYLIYVEGTIDMSEGKLPAEGSTMDGAHATDEMNTFVAENSDYSTYAEWLKANTNAATTDDTSTPAISNTYKNKIMIQIASNTAIIGIDDATIRGIDFSISSSNVVLRNLTLEDAVDPFPHHEKNDGFNAQHDVVCIDGGTNVWIDHCTFKDTLHCGTAQNGEKLQVYDGLCDMKSTATNITVSNCIFRDHDKTMLIGSSDNDGSSDKTARKVTLAYNYWIDCGQRCPLVRNTYIHVLNNVYDSKNRYYTSQSSINARAGSSVYAENNWFGSVASPSENGGTIYSKGISDYTYTAKTKSEVIAGAGAGLVSVNR